MYYALSYHLGSMTTIVNAGSEVENYSFNTWGMPIEGNNWTQSFSGELVADRGFAGPEHLAEFNLINMNCRFYDPIHGRFVSPDSYVQMPRYPNNYNRYTYALNNPLKFTDPSGYYNKPSPSEREKINEGGHYGGWSWNAARPQFQSYWNDYYASQSWSYNWATGEYGNSFTGDTKNANNFNNTVVPGLASYDHDLTAMEVVRGLYQSQGGTLMGTDPIGNQRYLFTNSSGAMKIIDYAFWKVTGDYYNELYYFSGLVAFDISTASASMQVPNLSVGAFHALVKRGLASNLNAINYIAGGFSFGTSLANTSLRQTRTGSNFAYRIAYSKGLLGASKLLVPIGITGAVINVMVDFNKFSNGQLPGSTFVMNTSVTAAALLVGGWPGLGIVGLYSLGQYGTRMTMEGLESGYLKPNPDIRMNLIPGLAPTHIIH